MSIKESELSPKSVRKAAKVKEEHILGSSTAKKIFKSQRDMQLLALSRMQSQDKDSLVTSKSTKSRKSAFTMLHANTLPVLPTLKEEEVNKKEKIVEELQR